MNDEKNKVFGHHDWYEFCININFFKIVNNPDSIKVVIEMFYEDIEFQIDNFSLISSPLHRVNVEEKLRGLYDIIEDELYDCFKEGVERDIGKKVLNKIASLQNKEKENE